VVRWYVSCIRCSDLLGRNAFGIFMVEVVRSMVKKVEWDASNQKGRIGRKKNMKSQLFQFQQGET